MSKITDALDELLSGSIGMTRFFRVTAEGVTEIDPSSVYVDPQQRGSSPAFEQRPTIPWDQVVDQSLLDIRPPKADPRQPSPTNPAY